MRLLITGGESRLARALVGAWGAEHAVRPALILRSGPDAAVGPSSRAARSSTR